MTITIRSVEGEELAEIAAYLRSYAFSANPPVETTESALERLKYQLNAIELVVFEDDEPVVIAGSDAMTQNVRGRIFPMGGIYGVAAHPRARRKGYTRQVMVEMFKVLQAAGTPISGLYPFKDSFYTRLGYTLFPQFWKYKIDPQRLTQVFDLSLQGEVRLFTIAEGLSLYVDFIKDVQSRQHGFSLFDELQMTRLKDRNALWLAAATIDNTIVGMMGYNLEGFSKLMNVPFLFYRDTRGLYLLLDWLARHADQVNEIQIRLAPTEAPESWLDNLWPEAIRPFRLPMGRVIDVTQIGGMQTGPGRLTLQITDSYCPWNEGTFTFETVNGELTVRPGGLPDCDLTINGVNALIFGTHDPALFTFRGWGDPSPEIQAVMRQMFPAALPYMYENY